MSKGTNHLEVRKRESTMQEVSKGAVRPEFEQTAAKQSHQLSRQLWHRPEHKSPPEHSEDCNVRRKQYLREIKTSILMAGLTKTAKAVGGEVQDLHTLFRGCQPRQGPGVTSEAHQVIASSETEVEQRG
jgi:hypothetical protein